MDAARFESLRRDYDVIPIARELGADTVTPVAAFAAISGRSPAAFLFESVERGENLGRYSFIGFAPRRTLTFDRETVDPVATLRGELVPLRVFGEESLPPFFGGAIGFFGYGVAGWSERLPDRHERDGIPDAKLLFCDNVIAFDHLKQKLFIIASLFTKDPRSSEDLVAEAARRIAEAGGALRDVRADLIAFDGAADLPFTSNCTRAEFVSMVRRAKEEIVAGEVFQIVLSQKWSTQYPASEALTLYRALRSINPSPYMFLLRTTECTLVGASPEMLVRATRRIAETRPIAGTRPRGSTREEDSALGEELLADPKENAEHLMLVDLGRNDLGRVATRGSVRVSAFREVERYSHVMHMVSNVVGELGEGKLPIDLFLSCFPAGTVSGAPKIRAMELIDEIEPARRGPYAGAVVYVGFSGNLDSCIAIRTIVLADGVASVQAGAGIVYDSDPEKEYEETVSKSAALRRAIAVATAALEQLDVARSAGERKVAGA
jgi:anthranilate synthase component I